MKTTKCLAIGVMILLLSSCKPEVDYAQVINTIRHGQWHVSYFNNHGNVETDEFSGYVFVFNEDGTATAQNGTEITAGTWVVSNGNMSTELTFNFEPVGPLNQLNVDWHVERLNGTSIEMKYVNGGTNYLTIVKI